MGREIRRVPPDWQHPMYMHQYLGRPMEMVFHPLFDEAYEDALAEWEASRAAWDADAPVPDVGIPREKWRTRSQRLAEYPDLTFEDSYGEAPDPDYFRQRRWTPEEATAYQFYEDTSEGTPLSPVCPTREDLVTWLATATRDIQGHPREPSSRPGAEEFVRQGWVPTMVGSAEHGVEFGMERIDRVAREADVVEGDGG